MSSNHATPPLHRECANLRSLLPLQAHGLLAPDDAERLRAHVATCPRCQAELAAYARLDAALRRTVAQAPVMPFLAEEIMDRIESPIASAPPPSAPPPSGTPHRPQRLALALGSIAALVIIALFAHLLLAAHSGTTTLNRTLLGLPEPTATITYNPDQFYTNGIVGDTIFTKAPTSERDPRAVFANHLKINMCPTPPIGTVSVTWLTTSPTFGLALVEADCGGGTHNVALWSVSSMSNGLVCHTWGGGGEFNARPATKTPPPGNIEDTPTWLPLPHQAYIGQQVVASPASVPEVLYRDWLYADQTYATGRYVGRAFEPSSATTITLAGQRGWMTTDGAYTTVTFVLPGGQTFFFSGTASASSIQRLAGTTLAHLDDLFPHVGTPTPDPAFSC